MATQGYQQEYQNYQQNQSGQQGGAPQHYDPYGVNVENYYQVLMTE